MFEIKNRFTGVVIFRSETATDISSAAREALASEANLTEANLTGADLTEADLRWADLRWANLTEADLTEANLTGADLRWANLTRANLTEANLSVVEADIRRILMFGKNEVPALLQTLKEGKIDGSVYEGECACLCGTIANLQHCDYRSIPGLAPDSNSPAERWFLAIRKGDTPENSPIAKITAEWIQKFLDENPVEVQA